MPRRARPPALPLLAPLLASLLLGSLLAGGCTREGVPTPAARDGAVEVALLTAEKAAVPGRILTLGWRFRIDEGWHLYWHGLSDTGVPPSFALTLPAGWEAGPPALAGARAPRLSRGHPGPRLRRRGRAAADRAGGGRRAAGRRRRDPRAGGLARLLGELLPRQRGAAADAARGAPRRPDARRGRAHQGLPGLAAAAAGGARELRLRGGRPDGGRAGGRAPRVLPAGLLRTAGRAPGRRRGRPRGRCACACANGMGASGRSGVSCASGAAMAPSAATS
jgi:hypothetical protein